MVPFELPDHKRAAYHAAASVASNFLVTLQAMAEEVARDAGLEPAQARRLLAPLVRTTVENWVALGPEAALTGPVARGDEAHRQRAAPGHLSRLAPAPPSLRRARRAHKGDRGMKTIRTVAELREELGRRAPRRSASCPPWASCTRATSPSSAARARSATWSSSRSSSTRSSSARARTSTPTRATRRATPRWRRSAAPTSCSRPRTRRSTRTASPPRSRWPG